MSGGSKGESGVWAAQCPARHCCMHARLLGRAAVTQHAAHLPPPHRCETRGAGLHCDGTAAAPAAACGSTASSAGAGRGGAAAAPPGPRRASTRQTPWLQAEARPAGRGRRREQPHVRRSRRRKAAAAAAALARLDSAALPTTFLARVPVSDKGQAGGQAEVGATRAPCAHTGPRRRPPALLRLAQRGDAGRLQAIAALVATHPLTPPAAYACCTSLCLSLCLPVPLQPLQICLQPMIHEYTSYQPGGVRQGRAAVDAAPVSGR